MYRTDKQFMKNPATTASRIFIGNLPDGLIPLDLEDKFKNHGNILGLVLQRGFAFIQYEKESEAQSAIDNENNVMFHGRKINVKRAYDKKGKQPFRQQQNNQQQQPFNQQSPQQFNQQKSQQMQFNQQRNQPRQNNQQRQFNQQSNYQQKQFDQPNNQFNQTPPKQQQNRSLLPTPYPPKNFNSNQSQDVSGTENVNMPVKVEPGDQPQINPEEQNEEIIQGQDDFTEDNFAGDNFIEEDEENFQQSYQYSDEKDPIPRNKSTPEKRGNEPFQQNKFSMRDRDNESFPRNKFSRDAPQKFGNRDFPKKHPPNDFPKKHPPNEREDNFSNNNNFGGGQEDNYMKKKFPPRDHEEDPPVIGKQNEADSYGPPSNKRMRGTKFGSDFGPVQDNFREGPRSKFYGREDPFPQPNFAPPPPPVVEVSLPPDRNDCEIIVVSKHLTEYAEFIEQRLKSIGLIVDLLFPNEDVPIGRVLASISSRGCLFAILVMPQNEENRSLTLNVLHGIPQEHRNMPIDDALKLINRNFEAYMRGEKTFPDLSSNGTKMSLGDRHPEQMQIIFNLLAENRQLTTAQYEKTIKYLEERKQLQSEYEVSEGGENTEGPETDTKAAELQNRILNILNKSNSQAESPKTISVSQEVSTTVTPTPLLNDPSVQKALDSLLSGDMFKGNV